MSTKIPYLFAAGLQNGRWTSSIFRYHSFYFKNFQYSTSLKKSARNVPYQTNAAHSWNNQHGTSPIKSKRYAPRKKITGWYTPEKIGMVQPWSNRNLCPLNKATGLYLPEKIGMVHPWSNQKVMPPEQNNWVVHPWSNKHGACLKNWHGLSLNKITGWYIPDQMNVVHPWKNRHGTSLNTSPRYIREHISTIRPWTNQHGTSVNKLTRHVPEQISTIEPWTN